MLVLNDASMHKIKEVKEQIESWNTHISLIPGGLTRYLQPLDISINKPFKSKMRSKYANYCLEQNNCNVKVSQEDIISWVGET